ncbi:MAG: 5-(carboxyamino)imidazole ribonucleotide mutase [Alphaproteobacteria bacterium]
MAVSRPKPHATATRSRQRRTAPPVAIVMGSRSDWPTMQEAADILSQLRVSHACRVISAHRTPRRMAEFAEGAADEGFRVIIAGAGGAAHLPGMIASMTSLPVLGVPVESRALKGLDSLLSIAQMPAGIPVGTLAIGPAGARNAGLLAVAILALGDERLAARLARWRTAQTRAVPKSPQTRKRG